MAVGDPFCLPMPAACVATFQCGHFALYGPETPQNGCNARGRVSGSGSAELGKEQGHYVLDGLQLIRGGEMRKLIVNVFDFICMLLVLVPTGMGLIIDFAVHRGPPSLLFPGALSILVFLVTSFIAGGALTLTEIARNSRETTRLLRLAMEGR
jgi:hypothetical protein